MKPFRGTLFALLLLIVVGGIYWVASPDVTEPAAAGEDCNRLFSFEKHALTRIEIDQPGANGVHIQLSEGSDGEWVIDGENEAADRSMVNRARHQIHDLCSRAIIDEPEQPELYGLGALAAEVVLTLRGEEEIRFLVGDPNPTGVSYYIQPVGDPRVYTVKKSASDFWFSEIKAFRERRFARFDSKDAIALEAELQGPDGPYTLRFEQRSEREWDMTSPLEMSAHTEEIRRLLGRVQALKARDFVDVTEAERDTMLAGRGLSQPRARIAITFASQEPLTVLIGDPVESDDMMTMSNMLVEGDDTIQVARDGLLEDFLQDPIGFRNRRVVRMTGDDVTAVDVELSASEDGELEGKASVRYAAEQWLWEDGTQFPGSGAERVARSFAELEVETIAAESASEDTLEPFGLAQPVVEVRLTNRQEEEKVILIGTRAEPEVVENLDGEQETRHRRYVMVVGDPAIYVVSERAVLQVVEDLVRQRAKKADRDAERAANRERIPSALLEDETP